MAAGKFCQYPGVFGRQPAWIIQDDLFPLIQLVQIGSFTLYCFTVIGEIFGDHDFINEPIAILIHQCFFVVQLLLASPCENAGFYETRHKKVQLSAGVKFRENPDLSDSFGKFPDVRGDDLPMGFD